MICRQLFHEVSEANLGFVEDFFVTFIASSAFKKVNWIEYECRDFPALMMARYLFACRYGWEIKFVIGSGCCINAYHYRIGWPILDTRADHVTGNAETHN